MAMNTQEFIDKWADPPGERPAMARDIEALVADRIAALQADNARLREALKPFADNAEVWEPNESHFVLVYCRRGVKDKPDLMITVGNLFAAYDALDNQT